MKVYTIYSSVITLFLETNLFGCKKLHGILKLIKLCLASSCGLVVKAEDS